MPPQAEQVALAANSDTMGVAAVRLRFLWGDYDAVRPLPAVG